MSDDETMLAHYSAALDEVYRLRVALAYEARVVETQLSYTTLPKAVRSALADQVQRMRASARGEADAVTTYAAVPTSTRIICLAKAGAAPTLTRWEWEARR